MLGQSIKTHNDSDFFHPKKLSGIVSQVMMDFIRFIPDRKMAWGRAFFDPFV